MIRLNATIETDSPFTIPPSSQPDVLYSISDSSTLKGYNIYRSDLTGNPPYVKLNSSLYEDTIYVDPIPAGIEGKYCYYVSSVIGTYGSLTCESFSDTVCFDIPLGFTKNPEYFLHIYPNPVTDMIIIESERNIENISLIDCFGRVIIEKNGIAGTRTDISFSDLPQGIYMLNMVYDDDVIARKIIKQ
jgi:hypothetical protein